jgi:hypothetical protein
MHLDEKGGPQPPLPEAIRAVLSRYGRREVVTPRYVIIGVIRCGGGLFGGILAFAGNEMDAHRIKRALRAQAVPEYGGVGVKRTAWHPDGATFDVSAWQERVRELPATARTGSNAAVLSIA